MVVLQVQLSEVGQAVEGSRRDCLQLVALQGNSRSASGSFSLEEDKRLLKTRQTGPVAGGRCNLEVESVEGGGEAARDHLQEVAGHGEDLQAFGAVEHVLGEPGVAQLVVVEVHRPASRARERDRAIAAARAAAAGVKVLNCLQA